MVRQSFTTGLFYRFLPALGCLSTILALPLCAQEVVSQASLSRTQATQLIHSQPYFERNDGQLDGRVLYEAHGLNYSAFLTREGATLVLPAGGRSGKDQMRGFDHVVRLSFKGMNNTAEIGGVDKLPGYSNYFSGSDPMKWQTRVPQFARVRYKDIYPGIDVIFYIRDGRLEYDFAVAPGAGIRAIRMKTEGALLSLSSRGDVILREGKRELITLRKPHAEQPGTQEIAARYAMHGQEVGFVLGAYDHRRPLLIDPALIFSTFITSGLVGCDNISDLAADSSGVYIAGSTCASAFPLVAGGPAPTQGPRRVFVTKIDPAGSHVTFTSFIAEAGGNTGLAVDGSGAVYLAGTAINPDNNFPITSGAYSSQVCQHIVILGGSCALPFAAKLSADGATLLYSTFLQQASGAPSSGNGQEADQIAKIAVDDQGALYVTGPVSTQLGTNVLPLQVPVGAFQVTRGKLFALKLNPTGSALTYATYLDGASTGLSVIGIAADSSHSAYIAGSALAGYPTTAGALLTSSPAPNGFEATFVTKLSGDGASQVYSTYVDPLATGKSTPLALAIDPGGQAVIAGSALGLSTPTPGGAFVSKLNAAGSALVYSNNLIATPIQSSPDAATSLAVDSSGAAYVGGFLSAADAGSFVLLHPIQSYVSGQTPGIVAKLDTSGALVWSTFLGMVEVVDKNPQIAVDSTGNVYFLAELSELGTTAGTINPQIPGVSQLIKVAPSLGAAVPITTPGAISFAPTNVDASSSPVSAVLGNFGDASMSPVVSISGQFSETDDCSGGPVPGGAKCTIQIVFAPTTPGPQTGKVTVSFGGSPAQVTITLSGAATSPAVSLSAASLSFSPQAVGIASPAQNLVVTNTGTGPLSISSLQITGDFSQTNGCGAAIAPAGTCMVQVTFTPTALGARTGSLTITDNAPGSPHTVALSGTGTGPSLGLNVTSGGSASATVAAGGTASYSLAIGGQGMSGTAMLSCSGAPPAASCTVPGSMAFNSTTPATFSASVTTTARMVGALRRPNSGKPSWLWAAALIGIVVVPLAGTRRSRKNVWLALLGLLPLMVLCSCGGGSRGGRVTGTPAGTYTLSVTATSGSTTQSMNLTLTVQ